MNKFIIAKASGFDNYFIKKLLDLSSIAATKEEVPVAVLIAERKSKKIITAAHNLSEINKNPLIHAEIIAINSVYDELKVKYLYDYDMYVTLEPCIMCAAAISYARIGRLYYLLSNKKYGSVENGCRVFTSPSCLYRPQIYSDIFRGDYKQVLQNFFKKIRNNIT